MKEAERAVTPVDHGRDAGGRWRFLERARVPMRAMGLTRFTLLLALYMAAVANRSMLAAVADAFAPLDAMDFVRLASLFALVVATFWVMLNLVAWRGTARIACALLVAIALTSAYFTDTYGVVVDRSAIQSVFESNAMELGQWTSARMLLYLALAIPPFWFIASARISQHSFWRGIGARLLSFIVLGLVFGVTCLVAYVDLVTVTREHRELRHMINPISALNASRSYLRNLNDDRVETVQPLGLDARKGAGWSTQLRPRVLVLVVGESARASSFSVLGYGRPTTPAMERRAVTSYPNVSSCGTATAVSLPCMFSAMGKDDFERDEHTRQENLLDVLAHAGLTPRWFDNNTGSKRIAVRTGEVAISSLTPARSCSKDGCFDATLVDALERILAATPQRDEVIVLHQLGSHGPSYHERYPPAFRRFRPTCDSNQLQQCTQQQILNTYDNTIAYTDHVLDRIISVLESHADRIDPVMLYISDHGESTGERGVYLHGMPYFIAPKEQTHVPMIAWVSDGYAAAHGVDRACLDAARARPLSHDNLFHSVLGLLDIKTGIYDPAMDFFAACRVQPTAAVLSPG